jgi:uncharacterized protein (DUF2267 family)
MGNVESGPGPDLARQNSLSSGRPRSPAPDLATIDEENKSNSREDMIEDHDWDTGSRDWVDQEPDWADQVQEPDWADQENNGDYRNTSPPYDEKGAVGFEVQQEDNSCTDVESEDDSAYMTDNGTQSLMGASAAVFHYLEMAEQRQVNMQDDEISVSECSAAVFKLLEEEASRGNLEPVLQFLETASVVSQILLEDANSVSDASAAVFKVLDRHENQNNDSQGPPAAIYKLWDDAQSDGDTSVSERSAAVFKVLDGARSFDSKSVSEFSAQVFNLLDEAKSMDSQSVSDKSTAIFQILDGIPLNSPMSNATTLAFGNVHKPLYENPSNMPQIVEEHKDQHETQTYKTRYSETAHTAREDYPEVGIQFSDDGSSSTALPPPEATRTSNLSEEGEEYPIDLVFVENFDRAFNQFVAEHPKFLMTSPNLVHHMRVCKLQKLLEYMDVREREILTEMAIVKNEKNHMEKEFHLKLREASRKKAARQINLQSDLQKLAQSTKQMKTKMTWNFVDSCESRSKKQFQLRQIIRASNPLVSTRIELFKEVPEGEEGDALRDAIQASASTSQSYSIGVEQEKDLRQFQVDNAFMMSEITVLKKQLVHQQAAARKHAWVESVLLQMDATTMSKLKAKIMKKAGVRQI